MSAFLSYRRVCACIVFAGLATLASAVPGLINYQGRLTDSAGNPVTSQVSVTFSFYDAATDGNQLGGFSDTDAVTPADDGIYGTLIGDDPDNLIPTGLFSGDSVWLNVAIEGENLVPRKQITSVGYALEARNADTVDGLEASEISPVAFGLIDSEGFLMGGTNNVSCVHNAGEYLLEFSGETVDSRFAAFVTPSQGSGALSPVVSPSGDGRLSIKLLNSSGTAVSADFQFVVYKGGETTDSYTLSGTVTDDASGLGAENVSMTFESLSSSGGITLSPVQTATDGTWSKSGLVGRVRVTPVKAGVLFTPANQEFSSSATAVDFLLFGDTDGDGVADVSDNCPTAANPGQEDFDADGIGDVCDSDKDNDGYESLEDCDDFNPGINPGAEEVCDYLDNDCDGEYDEDAIDCLTWYADADGDGFGDPDVTICVCDPQDGWVADNTDCYDSDGDIYPGAPELCDGKDNDCDGETDEDTVDCTNCVNGVCND